MLGTHTSAVFCVVPMIAPLSYLFVLPITGGVEFNGYWTPWLTHTLYETNMTPPYKWCINHLRLGLRRPRPLQSVAQDAYRVTKETTQKGKQGILKLLLRWRTHPFSRYESQARPASCLTAVGVLSYCYMPVLNACSLSTRVE